MTNVNSRTKAQVEAEVVRLKLQDPSLGTRTIASATGISRNRVIRILRRLGEPMATEQPTAAPQIIVSPQEEHRLKRRIKELEHEREQILKQQFGDERVAEILTAGLAFQPTLPTWVRRPSDGLRDRAIAVSVLSDLHLDEVVFPAQVEYVNAYNRSIQEKRFHNYFQNLLKLSRNHINGIDYDGIVVMLGGDTFSGNIHEELQITNEAPILETLLHWIGPFCAGLKLLADDFGKVYCPAVVGNHGRLTRKPVAKNRVMDNYDWLFYQILKLALKDDERITFGISHSADIAFSVYDTNILLTHGDQFRGGGGIAGLLSPLMIGDHRKRKRQAAIGKPYDYMVMGHWHQLANFKGVIVNGSLKGYDEYAFISNFDFEKPQQAFFLIQPHHGKTLDAPVFVLDKGEQYDGNPKKTGKKPLEGVEELAS